MSNHSVLLQVIVNDLPVYQVQNPATKPSPGEYIAIPVRILGALSHRKVYVGQVVNKYPDTSDMDSPTIIECQCADV